MDEQDKEGSKINNSDKADSFVPVIAAGGIVYETVRRQVYVVLIYRKGYWDLPKGKREPDEGLEECAKREVGEEINILPVIKTSLGTTVHSYERDGVLERKTTYWYAMHAEDTESMKPETSEQIEKVSWYPLNTAIERVDYENLKIVLQRFRNLLIYEEKS